MCVIGAAQNCFAVNLENMAKEVIVIIHLAKLNIKIDSFTPVHQFSKKVGTLHE